MKHHLRLCGAALLTCFFTTVAHAVDHGDDPDMNTAPGKTLIEPRIVPDDHHYPTFMRATGIVQGVFQDGNPRNPTAGAQATVEIGQGLVTAEAGVSFFEARSALNVKDTVSGAFIAHSEMDRYVGIPILLKLNYIETPQASCSLKLGVMPAISITDTTAIDIGDSGGVLYDMGRTDTFAVIGVTGAAPIDERSEFVLDIAYDRGLKTLDDQKAHHGVITAGLGVRFDL